jgi:hypothetical protein
MSSVLRFASVMKPLKASLEWYNGYAKSHPLITMSVTTGLTWAFGSFACQEIKNRHNKGYKLDYRQICEYAAFGGLFTV